NNVGLGIKQSVRFSKEVTYEGNEVSIKIDNNNLITEDVAEVQSIQATPATVKLFLGQTRTFAVKATLADGTSQFVTLDAVCESSDPQVAYIRDGLIYAGQKEGKADISITYTDGFGTLHQTSMSIEASIPTNLYAWKAYDWYRNRVSDRLGSSDITYSSKENTITITKKGAQNIALRYMEKKYREPGMKYLVAVATEVSKTKGDSQLWFINGTWVNIVNPTDVRTLKDGRIMVSWSIDENKGYELTGETVFGLTSTNAQGCSVISYVGFTADLKALQQELETAVGITAIHPKTATTPVVYALSGSRVPTNPHQKGIYIKNDKKVMIR
ncbi:MAG: hypothetical protein J6Y04_02310, partial [Bacteroidaceae bacterium]|nr:hypothetical protein [Bacteroidaceae bacterium]